MIFAALRDLQWRRRRIVIAIVGTGLVFAMSLLMSGLANSFSVEVNRTLDRQGAQAWVILATSPGAFSPGSFLLPGDVVERDQAHARVDRILAGARGRPT